SARHCEVAPTRSHPGRGPPADFYHTSYAQWLKDKYLKVAMSRDRNTTIEGGGKLGQTGAWNVQLMFLFLMFCHRTSTFIEHTSAYSAFRRFPVPSFPMFLPCVHRDVDRERSAG